jgi:hypothetical protein
MPRKITIFMYAGYAGTDACEAYIVPDDVTDDELHDFAWERGVEHASMYGVYPYDDCSEEDEENEDWGSGNNYSDNIEGYWKPYSPEHDNHLICGSAKKVFWNKY